MATSQHGTTIPAAASSAAQPTTLSMISPSLPIRPLSADAFAPYGEALCWAGHTGQAINLGTSQRVDLPAGLVLWSEQGQPALAVFRTQARAVEGVWHHPLVALEAGDFLVIERSGAVLDCEEKTLAQAVALHWEAHTNVSQRR